MGSKAELIAALRGSGARAIRIFRDDCPPALQADPETVLTAVTENGDAFFYAADELRGDREFVCAAVAQNGNALRWASPELRADAPFMREAVALHRDAARWQFSDGSPPGAFAAAGGADARVLGPR